jgi:hypothetical protein
VVAATQIGRLLVRQDEIRVLIGKAANGRSSDKGGSR